MTRAATGDTVVVRPTSNVYTVLVIAAFVAVLGALVVVIWRARQMEMPLF
jgi:hypothetical protein